MSNKVSPNNSIKSILESSDLSAKKNLGQNFLHDSNIINKMIEGEDINSDDTILEIGPGLGTLTKPLSSKAKNIIAIEKDRNLADLPIVIAAIDPCFSCTDRMIRIRETGASQVETLTWGRLREDGIAWYRKRGIDMAGLNTKFSAIMAGVR